MVTEEELKNRHKKELKELQAKIQAIKKAVPKGDKKAKKSSVEEIAVLQKDLSDKHDLELKNLTDQVSNLNVTTAEPEPESRKMSKAEKRREAKASATQKKLEQISEMGSEVTKRSQEHFKISETLKTLDLLPYEIPADGNCMFYALQHQLQARGLLQSLEDLRETASSYMGRHEQDFLPYLVHPRTGDMLSSQEFGKYCEEIKMNGVWGGMHEAHAISSALEVPIKILQSDVRPITFGEMYEREPVILLYYKHKYGLGEHYDSVIAAR